MQMLRVYIREFRVIFSDQGLVVFFLFLPLAYPIIYSLIYNPELVRDVETVVVDHDRTAASRELVREMDATQGCRIIGYATDLDDARKALDTRNAYGILEIPEGFARNLGRGEQGKAVMYCEMSLLLRYRALLVSATDVSSVMGGKVTLERLDSSLPVFPSGFSGDPMPIESIAMGNIEGGFDSFIMPGIVILILHQCLILAIGMAGGAKREPEYMIGYDSFNEEHSVLATMLGQMLCYFTIIALPVIFLVHYVGLIFSFPMAGNILQEVAFLLPMIIAAISLGYIVQGVVSQRENIFVIWVVTSVVFLFLSGLTWPRFAMPEGWKLLSDIIPCTWGVEGFIKMNSNGSSLAQVSGEYINMWILAAVYFAGAYCVQRWVIRPLVHAQYPYTPAEVDRIEGDTPES